MGFSIDANLNNENHGNHKHITCPDFCVTKKMLLNNSTNSPGIVYEANKSIPTLKTTYNIKIALEFVAGKFIFTPQKIGAEIF